MPYLGKFVVPALSGASDKHVRVYLSLFESAIIDEVPPYFREAYGSSFRKHVASPVWVIQCLISNAIKEGEGSADLATVANGCPDKSLRAQLVSHVNDEARHSRLYLQLVELVFPAALPAEVSQEVRAQLPPLQHEIVASGCLDTRQLLDYLIQINLGEVRTRVHQKLLEPVLFAYCPRANRGKLRRALGWLSSDEARHIEYTAQRIGQFAGEDISGARTLFAERSRLFNAYTERELGTQRTGFFAPVLIQDGSASDGPGPP